MNNDRVLIIGGGIAGLMAAKTLVESGFAVTLLEARDRLGGRTHTMETGDGSYIEAGAEFVHGLPPLSLALLEQFQIPYNKTRGEMFYIENGKAVQEDGQIEGWNKLLRKMGRIDEDLTFTDFLNQNFGGAKNAETRDSAKQFASGFDLADPDTASTKKLFEEWNGEEEGQFRIEGGYKKLVDALAAMCESGGCEIITRAIVEEIRWKDGAVKTQDGRLHTGQKIIATIPLKLFLPSGNMDGTVRFAPALPAIIEAAGKVGHGYVIKAVLRFKTAFWNNYAEDAGFFFMAGTFPTWWSQLPDERPVLTGWLGGPAADAWSGKPASLLVDEALGSLALGFGRTRKALQDELVESHIFNWQDEEFSRGGYSFALPATNEALQVLKKPIENRLFFAGEATYEGKYPGTVEAALQSGLDAANRIIGNKIK